MAEEQEVTEIMHHLIVVAIAGMSIFVILQLGMFAGAMSQGCEGIKDGRDCIDNPKCTVIEVVGCIDENIGFVDSFPYVGLKCDAKRNYLKCTEKIHETNLERDCTLEGCDCQDGYTCWDDESVQAYGQCKGSEVKNLGYYNWYRCEYKEVGSYSDGREEPE